jgi:hypothetical protein
MHGTMNLKYLIPYHNCIYSRLPEGERSGSKGVEDTQKLKQYINLENVHFLGSCCVAIL